MQLRAGGHRQRFPAGRGHCRWATDLRRSVMSTEVTASTTTSRKPAPPPAATPRPPKLNQPPGACDTHIHLLGPQHEFPFNPQRNWVPDVDNYDSTMADWQQMQNQLGLS